jgi:hypothetical protein
MTSPSAMTSGGDPWTPEHGWRWIGGYTAQLGATEGADVARAFGLSALLAELAGLLVLAVRAAEIDVASARARAWHGVAQLLPFVRRSVAGASGAIEGLEGPARRSAALVDRVEALAATAPAAAPVRPVPARARRSPPPDGGPETLRRWLMTTGPQPALDILSAAAAALPGLALDCAAWAAEVDEAWRALG